MEGWEIVDWTNLAYKTDQWRNLGEHGNETSEYISSGNFHDLLRNLASHEGLSHGDKKTVISLVSLLVRLLVSWFVGWLVGWLGGWVVGCLVGYLFSHLVG
jgi:hypothetical protein